MAVAVGQAAAQVWALAAKAVTADLPIALATQAPMGDILAVAAAVVAADTAEEKPLMLAAKAVTEATDS